MHSSPSQHNPRAHSRACARSQRVGTFRRRAAACAGFVLGEYNASACPLGSSKIVLEAACASVAAALGRTYVGSETSADFPSGCYIANNSVYFNGHPTGAPRDAIQPLCAGAPDRVLCACACEGA